MNRLSKFTEQIDWILASPASDSEDGDAEIFVSRKSVKQIGSLLRTYVLINHSTKKNLADNRGKERDYLSAIYRRDLSVTTNISRISSITFFSDLFAKGSITHSFFYYNEAWSSDTSGFTEPLIQFMFNHAPSHSE